MQNTVYPSHLECQYPRFQIPICTYKFFSTDSNSFPMHKATVMIQNSRIQLFLFLAVHLLEYSACCNCSIKFKNGEACNWTSLCHKMSAMSVPCVFLVQNGSQSMAVWGEYIERLLAHLILCRWYFSFQECQNGGRGCDHSHSPTWSRWSGTGVLVAGVGHATWLSIRGGD